jgi:bacterioferritin-associated ferredoxin
MYVCICNALTDRRIRGAIESGAGSLGAVYRTCGAAPQCGKCGEMIRSLLVANDEAGQAPAAGACQLGA